MVNLLQPAGTMTVPICKFSVAVVEFPTDALKQRRGNVLLLVLRRKVVVEGHVGFLLIKIQS